MIFRTLGTIQADPSKLLNILNEEFAAQWRFGCGAEALAFEERTGITT